MKERKKENGVMWWFWNDSYKNVRHRNINCVSCWVTCQSDNAKYVSGNAV